ncbi:MAG: HD domain-containing protein [Candidatus Peribacteraceae bacterium]|nr:HD domain-containing protein [Candidatus Peribacteraceae bacterium]
MNKAPLLTPRLRQAVSLVFRAHGGMSRKGDGQPYLLHPIHVLALLIDWHAEEDTCIAGLLHDVIEDADDDTQRAAYREEIKKTFGENVLEIVEGVTEQDKSLPWRTRKERYLEHLRTASKQSLLVSCADRIHNTSSLLLAYRKDGERVWKRFNAGKEEQLWYVKSVRQILEERLGASYTKELDAAIGEIECLNTGKKPHRKSAVSEGSPRVPAAHFHYLFDDWRNAALRCFVCGWTGKIKHEDTEVYDSLFDYSCPKCDKMLAIVSYPTQEEDEAWGKATPGDAVMQFDLSVQFFFGIESTPDHTKVKRNINTAIGLLMRAAEQEFPRAQFHLGAASYWQDFGSFFGVDIEKYVPHDSAAALDLIERAACGGLGIAQMMLAEWCENGNVVEMNETLGALWHEIANMNGQYSPVKNGDLYPSPANLGDIERYRALRASRLKHTTREPTGSQAKSRGVTYTVLVDDNFHPRDSSERYELGAYATLEEAESACKKIVDEYLLSTYKPGMAVADLYTGYTSFGEDPFVVPRDNPDKFFSAWNYAKQRSQEICGESLSKHDREGTPKTSS